MKKPVPDIKNIFKGSYLYIIGDVTLMTDKTKFIFITGGVCSSLGKGISTASLGILLEGHGYKISILKMDPYLNIDPGTMSPYQHGEVYVTEDGAETDLDLGYYERFTNSELTRKNSVSTGQIYLSVIERERRGDYLGRTVQVIPHITNEIKKRIFDVSKSGDLDFVLVEIGGTVGDIESVPFLEAIRQMRMDLGKNNVLFVHLTLVPAITVAGEHKTKPTQHSVKELMQTGILPDILLCRSSRPLDDEMKAKIALFCNVEDGNVISALDSDSIYDIPMMLHGFKYDDIVLEHFNKPKRELDISEWLEFVDHHNNPEKDVTIGIVGKYVSLQDAYKSIYEALIHGAAYNRARLKLVKIDPEELEGCDGSIDKVFSGVDGVLVPGGFGSRGIEGKIKAIEYARINNIPFFGICLGLHTAVIEFARNVCGLEDANSTEFNPECKNPVISLMEDQKIVQDKGASMRLGAFACKLLSGSGIADIYQKQLIHERHRHRYEFTSRYKKIFEDAGMVFGGINPDLDLVETLELPEHRWFYAVQFHPEFKSKPTAPHPLFKTFITASVLK